MMIDLMTSFALARSAAAVIAYLMHRDGLGYDDALAAVRAARPSARPNEGFVRQLRDYEAALRYSEEKDQRTEGETPSVIH